MKNTTNCEKKTFEDITEARERLTEIVLTSTNKVKPIRVYKCEKCNKYHLTSKSKGEFNEIKLNKAYTIKRLNKKREDIFIARESKYWESYFGINK